jgi:hypothetical protein
MLCKTVLLAGALALSAFAAPIPDCTDKENSYTAPSTDNKATYPTGITAEQLTTIAPETASCSGAPFPEECADADTAATALNKSFDTYGIKTAGEKAALLPTPCSSPATTSTARTTSPVVLARAPA